MAASREPAAVRALRGIEARPHGQLQAFITLQLIALVSFDLAALAFVVRHLERSTATGLHAAAVAAIFPIAVAMTAAGVLRTASRYQPISTRDLQTLEGLAKVSPVIHDVLQQWKQAAPIRRYQLAAVERFICRTDPPAAGI